MTEAAPQERKKPGPKPKPKAAPTEALDLGPLQHMPVPTAGRIVMYVTVSGTIRPAIISRVHSGEVVDLTVFNSEGSVAVRQVKHESIEQEWIEDATDIAGSWHWPL